MEGFAALRSALPSTVDPGVLNRRGFLQSIACTLAAAYMPSTLKVLPVVAAPVFEFAQGGIVKQMSFSLPISGCTMTIANTVSPEKCLGSLGAAGLTRGTFDVKMTATNARLTA